MIQLTKPVVTNIEFLDPVILFDGQIKDGTRYMKVYFMAVDSQGKHIASEDITQIYSGQDYNSVSNNDFITDKTLAMKVFSDLDTPADFSKMPDNLTNPIDSEVPNGN